MLKASLFQTEQTTDLMSQCPGALWRSGKAGSPRRGPSLEAQQGERPAAGVTFHLRARASSYSASTAGVASPAHVQREAPGREQTQRDEKRRWPGCLLPRRREAARAVRHGTARLRACPLHSLRSGRSEACVSERGGFQRGRSTWAWSGVEQEQGTGCCIQLPRQGQHVASFVWRRPLTAGQPRGQRALCLLTAFLWLGLSPGPDVSGPLAGGLRLSHEWLWSSPPACV